jgi:hypothetical protein
MTVVATVLLTGAIAAGAASAAVELQKPRPGQTLSARLLALSHPTLRGASGARQAEAVSLAASGPGSLLRQGRRLVVEARFDRPLGGDADAVRAAGATVLGVHQRYRTITAAVDPGRLRALGDVKGVASVTEELTPITAGTGDDPAAGRAAPCSGGATSEGDVQLRADVARRLFGVDGRGTKVGILSNSYDQNTADTRSAAQDVASGDIPGPGNPCGRTTPVQVLDDTVDGTDEGRGMAQIVHDLAPGAQLAFATAANGMFNFADNIRALRTAGAKVIVDDVAYFSEPYFQDGPVAAAINDVTAQGTTYFSAAGNSNIISGGNNVSSFEAPAFREDSCSPLPGNDCMDFDSGAAVDPSYEVTLPGHHSMTMALQWAEPWNGVTTDLDMYLVFNGSVISSGVDDNLTTQQPFEIVGANNTGDPAATVQVFIRRSTVNGGDDADPRLKTILLNNGDQTVLPTEYTTSTGGDIVGPSIFGHSGAKNAMSTAAVPYSDSTTPEAFSSRGPETLYFRPVNGSRTARPLDAPQALAKPDVAATDGGATTFFGQDVGGVLRFFGTSAAAPHAAAVAALIRDGDRNATVAQIKAAEKHTARAVGAFGPEAVGAGLIDARAAVASRLPKVTISDAGQPEGNSGTQNLNFTVTLSKPSATVTNLRYSTSGGTATPDFDYVSQTNVRKFIPAGATTATISVPIQGDTVFEETETFNLGLSSPTRLKLDDKTALGLIVNDDCLVFCSKSN